MPNIIGYRHEKPGNHPPNNYPGYTSTVKRAPRRAPIRLDHTLTETTGPTFTGGWEGPNQADLTRAGKGEPIGERIIVTGRVLDEDGRPVAGHAGGNLAGQCCGALSA